MAQMQINDLRRLTVFNWPWNLLSHTSTGASSLMMLCVYCVFPSPEADPNLDPNNRVK